MKRTVHPNDSRQQIDSANGSATSSGAWVIEMRPVGSGRATDEHPMSDTTPHHNLIEQTFHHLRGFLDRLYR